MVSNFGVTRQASSLVTKITGEEAWWLPIGGLPMVTFTSDWKA